MVNTGQVIENQVAGLQMIPLIPILLAVGSVSIVSPHALANYVASAVVTEYIG